MSDPSYQPPGGGAGGVTSFNTRQGAVVLSKADVTATGLAAADVGAVPSPLAITFDSGVLAADVNLATGSMTDILTTNALAIGKWLITATVNVINTSASNAGDAVLQVTGGTATYTIDGPDGIELTLSITATNTYRQSGILSFIAEITVAGTVKIRGQNFGSGTTVAKAADSPIVHASGYTALKVA